MNAKLRTTALAGALAALLPLAPMAAQAQETPGDFTEIVAEVSPTVVAIIAQRLVPAAQERRGPMRPFGGPDPNGPPRQAAAQGSGFVISEEGHIVTNNHVIQEATQIEVLLADGSRVPAELIGTDPATDLAVLQVEDLTEGTAVADWGDSEALLPGAWTIAIGSPFGLGETVTVGVLSARSRDIRSGPYDEFLQTDASINQGNSGGPLFNAQGEVIGVNTAIFSPTGANVGIGFAVPSRLATLIVNQLIEDGGVRRGFIGVSLQPMTEVLAQALGQDEAQGALVSQVVPDGPAAEAGLEAGDVVLQLDGEDIEMPRDLSLAVAELAPDTTAVLTILRGGEQQEIEVTIGLRDAPRAPGALAAPDEALPEAERMGVSLAPLPAPVRRELGLPDDIGAMVQNVVPGSRAQEAGLRRNDVIVEAGARPIRSPGDLSEAWQEARADERPLLMRVMRGTASLFIAIGV
jgi:serine protease Do